MIKKKFLLLKNNNSINIGETVQSETTSPILLSLDATNIGPTGPTGLRGVTGLRGATGPTGLRGATGPTG